MIYRNQANTAPAAAKPLKLRILAAPVYSGAPVPVDVLLGPTGVAVALPPDPDPPVVPLWTPELPEPEPPDPPEPEPPVPTAVPEERMIVLRPDETIGVVEIVGGVIGGGITPVGVLVTMVGVMGGGITPVGVVEVGQKVVVNVMSSVVEPSITVDVPVEVVVVEPLREVVADGLGRGVQFGRVNVPLKFPEAPSTIQLECC